MKWRTVSLLSIAAFGLATVGAQARSTVADEKLAPFMQQKLLHSEKTLEGLAKGDFELIARHSQAMSLLCEDELWSVIQTPEYLERSKEFKRSVNAITIAAREKNLEAATLSYVTATTSCVTCHKYLRQKR